MKYLDEENKTKAVAFFRQEQRSGWYAGNRVSSFFVIITYTNKAEKPSASVRIHCSWQSPAERVCHEEEKHRYDGTLPLAVIAKDIKVALTRNDSQLIADTGRSGRLLFPLQFRRRHAGIPL